MKTIICTLGAIILISSCSSLEKMVDEGNYDEAILTSAKRLSGQKKKKTKHIKYLEEAFRKANQEDLDMVDRLKISDQEDVWDLVFDHYLSIQERQDMISPFLPLVSKDGYEGNFVFVDVNEDMQNTGKLATEFHYKEAMRFMNEAVNGSKMSARSAFEEINMLERYTSSYKDSHKIKEDAKFMGTRRVLIRLENNVPAIMPIAVEQEVMSIYVKDMNSFWTSFYTTMPPNMSNDVLAILEVDIIDLSPEREVINNYVDTAEVKDGFEYALDDNGNVMKDTSGNDIKVDKYVTVLAEITEIFRTKSAISKGRLVVIDELSGENIVSVPMTVETNFESYASSYRGDKRALHKRTKSRLRSRPEQFPSNYDMTMDVAHLLKEFMKNELMKINI